MPSFDKCLALVSIALSASALTTPHVAGNTHRHHDVAARISAIESLQLGGVENILSTRQVRSKRRNGRCKPPTSSIVTVKTQDPPSPAINVDGSAPTPSNDGPKSASKPVKTSPVKPTTTPPPKPPAGDDGSDGSDGDESSHGGDGGPSFMHGTQTGQGTFYGTGLGACGIINHDDDMIAAVSRLLFDTYPGYRGGNPNENPMCGRKITATYQGKSVTVTVTDRCEDCAITDLDFSPAAFKKIADPNIGRLSGVTWVWN